MAPCFICIGCIIPPVVTGTDDTDCIKNDDPPTDYCAVGTHTHTLPHTTKNKKETNKKILKHTVTDTEHISLWDPITLAWQPTARNEAKINKKTVASPTPSHTHTHTTPR